ncbi:hypothetical protein PRK78_006462 [Emydomyces testavorans]|uniref:Tubulin-specific chaperone D n=1 Tax=Emydomyces testavorans TaxID=2070801 RepID=A0AAF0IKV0_9EURO|nr:hypothetical protein PRK78_006462 [Emydomyces testavorans]
MDAPTDRDIELQRASGDLINELKIKLPPLLWKSSGDKRQVHRWAHHAKTDKLTALLEPFQEWPQLLDPHLQGILSQLTEAFLTYLGSYRHEYASTAAVHVPKDGVVYPVPRAICRLIYTLCKIRGVKVITRFLNNEPKYLEPILLAFIDWDSVVVEEHALSSSAAQGSPLTWEERYVMLTWLSHLFLAPFDLASISSTDIPIPYDNLSALLDLSEYIPPVALSALSIALKYAVLPGKEREAAIAVLARLALRLDMQRLGLLEVLIRWAFSELNLDAGESTTSGYACIGALSFIARLGVLGRVDDLAQFVVFMFERTAALSISGSWASDMILSSAASRKIVIKIFRSIAILALTLEKKLDVANLLDKTSLILEHTIDYFLLALADKDTPVRFAASKALSMVTLKLHPEMASDIVEAVLEALEENVLYEKQDGTLVSRFQLDEIGSGILRQNTSAVNPQRWQGLILTMGHLLFRRALPPGNLGQVLRCLISGLDFDQRTSTGSSVGGSVRDASCFGIWSVARKYSTSELCALDPREVNFRAHKDENVLQILATQLVCAACLDPSGNIRRGASAALQELIGRHPDMVFKGISLVQIVDYHAVARRAKAIREVAKDAASLGKLYWEPLLDGMLQWRGMGSPDSGSRKAAASAIGELAMREGYKSILIVLQQTIQCLSVLSPYAIEARHGCFLSLASILDAFVTHRSMNPGHEDAATQVASELSSEISKLWEILNSPMGPSVDSLTLPELRPDLTAEASAHFLSSLARSCAPVDGNISPTLQSPPQQLLHKAINILNLCVSRGDDISIEASSEAASDLFVLLSPENQMDVVKRWLHNIDASWKSSTGRGQISALGAVYKQIPTANQETRSLIIRALLKSTGEDELISKRSSAVFDLLTGTLPAFTDTRVSKVDVGSLSNYLQGFLSDYTTDRRGDIGSFIRLEAINGVNFVLKSNLTSHPTPPYVYDLMKCIARLAAEKLDKVRFEAWRCLGRFWESETALPSLQRKYEHASEVSSAEYFSQLFALLSVDWIRPSLTKGLVTSVSAGTEGLVRSSRLALVHHIRSQDENEQPQLKKNLFNELVTTLEDTMEDDRYAIPTVDTISFLLDNCFEKESASLDFR